MKNFVEIENLHKQYARGSELVEVLMGIDLTIQHGEFVALMGPSGSGKTTLLNLIGGLDRPTSGSVVVDGNSIASMTDVQLTRWRARHVGFIFQFYNLLPMLNAIDNVELPLLLDHLPQAERRKRAELALSLVQLEHRRTHRPNELSGGQQQRVAIARAIVKDPTLLVCDEPTGDLDRESSASIMQLLAQLNQEFAKTIVMVTHDPKAAQYAQRTIHLDKGRIVAA